MAARKVALLQRAGAVVTVVAPELYTEITTAAGRGELVHIERSFQPADIDGMVLVIAATDNESVNREVSELARQRRGRKLCWSIARFNC